MKTVDALSPAETLRVAEEWFGRQLGLLAMCHGDDWVTHRAWITEYLRQEIRQRLIARGWRSKR